MSTKLEQRDRRDLAFLADAYMLLDRCQGGRYIRQGYQCAHCGSESPKEKCEGRHKKYKGDDNDDR